MEEIKSCDGNTIAIVIRKDFNKEGINFLSKNNSPLQLGINSYKKGHKINSHFHQQKNIEINKVQEVIYVKTGKTLAKLFDLNKNVIRSVTLSTGDLIFLVDGGHGFEMSEDTTFIEVKQGPYSGKENDKESI